MWQSASPWIDSVVASRPYWIVRTGSGLILAAGFVSLLLGLTTGPAGAGRSEVDTGDDSEPLRQVSPRLTSAAALEAS
jgi:hypothetical protein